MKKKIPIGEGHGIKGRYAGLPNEFCNDHSKIAIVSVPFEATTTYQKGTKKGPEALIEASRNLELYDIETDSSVYQWGIKTHPPIKARTSPAMIKSLYQTTKELLAADKFVVALGGEHSISYASIKAFAEHFGKISILQLDAHADLQEAYEGNPWSHASVMARVQEIPQVETIVSVGIRSLAETELPRLDKSNTYFAHKLRKKWISEVIKKLKSPVYVTFDLDVFDSSLMPATGTPEPGGLDWKTAMKLLKQVAKEKEIVGFDVVELCPQKGNSAPDYLAAKLVYKLLSYIFRNKQ